MRQLVTCTGTALLVAGCLSGPKPLGVDGGDGDGDSGIDAPVDRGMPFPGGHAVNIRDVIVVDVNGDGPSDLVLINSAAEAEDRGVFVLHSPQSDDGDLRYHQFANTTAVPYHAVFENIVGNNLLDLIIVGVRDGSPNGVIEVYEQGDDGTFTLVVSRVVDGFTPDVDFPITVAVGAFSGTVINDFAVADLFTLLVYLVNDMGQNLEQELPVTNPVALSRAGSAAGMPFESINGLLPRRVDTGLDDLFVIEGNDVHWLETEPASTFAPNPTANNGTAFPLFTFVEIDLDDVLDDEPPLDIIGGGLVDFGAWFLDPAGSTVTIESADWNTELLINISDLAAGNLDSIARPEVVVLQADMANGSNGQLLFFPNATRNGAEMSPADPLAPFTISEIAPDRGEVIDFDNSGENELWVFDVETGEARCIELSNAVPAFCP